MESAHGRVEKEGIASIFGMDRGDDVCNPFSSSVDGFEEGPGSSPAIAVPFGTVEVVFGVGWVIGKGVVVWNSIDKVADADRTVAKAVRESWIRRSMDGECVAGDESGMGEVGGD